MANKEHTFRQSVQGFQTAAELGSNVCPDALVHDEAASAADGSGAVPGHGFVNSPIFQGGGGYLQCVEMLVLVD